MGISKRFGSKQALDDVSFTVRAGTMHMLLGENGAGKSTLMKILMGFSRADSGVVKLHGHTVENSNPREARARGLGMVFQTQALIPSLTVAENLVLADERIGIVLPGRRPEASPSRFLDGIDLNHRVSHLSRGERQRVEIERLLSRGAEILILDEPTAVLSPADAALLFTSLEELKQSGKTILVITHRLAEVESYADFVTVLRGGQHVATRAKAAASSKELATLMVGGVSDPKPVKSRHVGDVILSIEDLKVRGIENERPRVQGLSLEVRVGELVGVAGVAGNGQKELVEVIMRERQDFTGRVRICCRDLTEARDVAVAYVPDDARQAGVARTLSISENVMMRDFMAPRFSSGPFLDFAKLSIEAKERLDLFKTDYSNIEAPAKVLSGGNLQRLVLSREFGMRPSLAIIVNPTAGLDIKATVAVHDFLRDMVAKGCAVLLVSYDLDEILELSDRVIVMGRDRVSEAKKRLDVDASWLGEQMGGATRLARVE